MSRIQNLSCSLLQNKRLLYFYIKVFLSVSNSMLYSARHQHLIFFLLPSSFASESSEPHLQTNCRSFCFIDSDSLSIGQSDRRAAISLIEGQSVRLALGRADILIHSILVFIITAIRSIIILNFLGRFLRSARRGLRSGRPRLIDGLEHLASFHRGLSDCVSFDGGMQNCKQNNKLIAVQIVNNALELRQ